MSLSNLDFSSGPAAVTRLANGHVRVDEYAWMHDINDPVVLRHLEIEEISCDAVLRKGSPDVETVFRETCDRLDPEDRQVPVPAGDYLYFMRYDEAREHLLHCRRPKHGGEEEVILDESQLPQKDTSQVAALTVSPDHRSVLFAISEADERCSLYVKAAGEDHSCARLVAKDVAANAVWVDDRRIAYLALDEAMRPFKLMIADVSENVISSSVLHVEADRRFHLSVRRGESGRFIYLTARTLQMSHVWCLSSDDCDATLVELTRRQEGVDTYISDQGPYFYYLTNENAPDFKLVRRRIEDSEARAFETVLAHEDGRRLAHIQAFSNYLIVLHRSRMQPGFKVISQEGQFEIPGPEQYGALHLEENRDYDSPVFRFAHESFVTPYTVVDFDLERRTVAATVEMKIKGYDRARYRADRIEVTASDGRSVPVSLVRACSHADAAMPLVLYCYGAYGHSIDPEFSAARLSLLDRGIGYGIVHCRGGGEGGDRWHREGRGLHKPRAVLDVVEAAEALVDKGIGQAGKIALFGQSAGGLVAAAAVNRRSDLFRALVADVAFLDPISTLLDEDHPFTPLDREEWGNPNVKAELETLLTYAPYDNVRTADYPAALLTGGFHDSHVGIWEPAKMAARLRSCNTAPTPILFHPRLDGGHEMAAGESDELWEWSMIFTFLIQQLQQAQEGR